MLGMKVNEDHDDDEVDDDDDDIHYTSLEDGVAIDGPNGDSYDGDDDDDDEDTCGEPKRVCQLGNLSSTNVSFEVLIDSSVAAFEKG